jgi:hypothetical protein
MPACIVSASWERGMLRMTKQNTKPSKKRQQRWSNPEYSQSAFRGTLIDPFSFMVDIEDWEYLDIRDTEPLVDEEGELL